MEKKEIAIAVVISVILSVMVSYAMMPSQGEAGLQGIQGAQGPQGIQGPPEVGLDLTGTWELIYDEKYPGEMSVGHVEFSFTATEDIIRVKWEFAVDSISRTPGTFRIWIIHAGTEYLEENYGPSGAGTMYLLGSGFYNGYYRARQDETAMSVQVYQLRG